MLAGCDLQWTKGVKHCFLIREPAAVIHSYTNSRGVCTSDDIGIVRQYELYESISNFTGQEIPVIESSRILQDPAKILSQLCEMLGIEFDLAMLSWPKGCRDSDGVWASHWYHSVEQSTGFSQPKKVKLELDAKQQALANELQPYYEALKNNELAL
jgi:hypothetical protein